MKTKSKREEGAPQKKEKFLPILLGSDENVYGNVRLFREAFPVTPLVLCGALLVGVRKSRLCEVRVVPGLDREEVFVPTLRAVLEEKGKEAEKIVVVPCSDYYAELLSRHYGEFEGRISNATLPPEQIEELNRKDRFYEICKKYRLDFPKTRVLTREEGAGSLSPAEEGFSYPVVLKPENSNATEYLHCHFPGKKKVFFLHDEEQYKKTVEAVYAAGYTGKLILQEFIPGGDDAMRVVNTYSGNDGRVRLLCLGQAVLEEYSPATLGNYAAVITRGDDDLYEKIEGFLNAIHYVGFANFDLKYDRRTGKTLVFEINNRPGRSSFFTRAAGCNLMKTMVEDAVEGKPCPTPIRTAKTALWTEVPRGVLMKYTENEELKREIKALWKKGTLYRTLFCREDKGLRRRAAVLRYYYSFYKNYRKYYFKK